MKKRTGPTSIPPVRNPRVIQPKTDKGRIYINLGRTGDAIASVPLCYLYWKETGKKPAFMVAREFSGFFEGISYIEPVIWAGDWRDVHGARAKARMMGYQDIVVPQIYGHNLEVHHTESSFLLESWKRVGRLNDFFTAPLVFDNRNIEREQLLIDKLPKGRPIVLVAADGTSSPFRHRDELISDITTAVGDLAHVVDLKEYRTDHFQDFLGVFDVAACLVTIDTGFGQLACGSHVPVVALAANRPSNWYSSPRRPQHVAYIRYNEYHERKQEMINAVMACVGKEKPVTIHHAWAGVNTAGEALDRHLIAKVTWDREAKDYGHWRDCRFTEDMSTRSALDLGDKVALPFLHDMLDYAARDADDSDVLLLTNADISLVPGLANSVASACRRNGSAYCHRWDFKKVRTHINRNEITKGQWYVGCDLFAVTKAWWIKNRANLPPFVLGRECWDWVFRELIKQTGGKEIPHGIYHEKHASQWEMSRGLMGNLHNRSYARAWLESAKIPLAEIEKEPYLKVKWPLK